MKHWQENVSSRPQSKIRIWNDRLYCEKAWHHFRKKCHETYFKVTNYQKR